MPQFWAMERWINYEARSYIHEICKLPKRKKAHGKNNQGKIHDYIMTCKYNFHVMN